MEGETTTIQKNQHRVESPNQANYSPLKQLPHKIKHLKAQMPSLSSQSLLQERGKVVQLWRGGGDSTRTADKETRVPFKNQLKILEVWKLASLITTVF